MLKLPLTIDTAEADVDYADDGGAVVYATATIREADGRAVATATHEVRYIPFSDGMPSTYFEAIVGVSRFDDDLLAVEDAATAAAKGAVSDWQERQWESEQEAKAAASW